LSEYVSHWSDLPLTRAADAMKMKLAIVFLLVGCAILDTAEPATLADRDDRDDGLLRVRRGFWEKLQERLTSIVEESVKNVKTGWSEVVVKVEELGFVEKVKGGLEDAKERIDESLEKINETFADSGVYDNIKAALTGANTKLTEGIETITTKVTDSLDGALKGLEDARGKIKVSVKSMQDKVESSGIVDNVMGRLNNALEKINENIQRIAFEDMKNGLKDATEKITSSLGKIQDKVEDSVKAALETAKTNIDESIGEIRKGMTKAGVLNKLEDAKKEIDATVAKIKEQTTDVADNVLGFLKEATVKINENVEKIKETVTDSGEIKVKMASR